MGFHPISESVSSREAHHFIALSLIRENLGNWPTRQSRRFPEIRVKMISNLSRIYRPPVRGWWARWGRRLGLS